jgi:hypothetical protein
MQKRDRAASLGRFLHGLLAACVLLCAPVNHVFGRVEDATRQFFKTLRRRWSRIVFSFPLHLRAFVRVCIIIGSINLVGRSTGFCFVTKFSPMLAAENIEVRNPTEYQTDQHGVIHFLDLFRREFVIQHANGVQYRSARNYHTQFNWVGVLDDIIKIRQRIGKLNDPVGCACKTVFRERLSGICDQQRDNIGLALLSFSQNPLGSYPSALVYMQGLSLQRVVISSNRGSSAHFDQLEEINYRDYYTNERERNLHPVVTSMPIRLIIAAGISVAGWFIGYRGRIAWSRARLGFSLFCYAIMILCAAMAVHVFAYL